MTRAVIVLLLLGLGLAAPVAPAVAAAPNCAPAGPTLPQVTWPQLALGLSRTGPLSRGGGVTVAVLATGVDAGQPQLAGRVEPGASPLPGAAADTDCTGTGTQVAGVIAAARRSGSGFAGVAPAARIYPVRVADSTRPDVDPAVLAAGIRAATAARVGVICVPLPAYRDTRELRDAVAAALDAGIPVVAAAGDAGADGNPPAYPAAYPGVISVTALDATGAVVPAAGFGDDIAIGAPGAQVTTTQTGRGLVAVDGTAVASGFVAGTVALLRAHDRTLKPAEIIRVLVATANRTQDAIGDPNLAGLVDPYRALTEPLGVGAMASLPAYRPPPARDSDAAAARVRRDALALAFVVLVVAVVVGVLAFVAPRARRRSWRPVVAPRRPPAVESTDDPGPPVLLFGDLER